MEGAVRRAIRWLERRDGAVIRTEEGVISFIAASSGGDVRKAVNAVELLYATARREGGEVLFTLSDAGTVSQRSAMRYDREGDAHFDILSALHKSIRGSDADAALHYLARLLEADDLLSACRRILCAACEDIGLAYPMAIPIVKACVDAALQLGMPEARLPLADAVILLCTAPKSNSGVIAIDRSRGCPRRPDRRGCPASCRTYTPTVPALSGSRATCTRTTSPPLVEAAVSAGCASPRPVLRIRREQDGARPPKKYWDDLKREPGRRNSRRSTKNKPPGRPPSRPPAFRIIPTSARHPSVDAGPGAFAPAGVTALA
jgi:hypothetical protein